MRRLILLCGFLAVLATGHARPFLVVAYNVENLMDLDGITEFAEYQPSRYTRAHALTKLQNASRVLAQFENGRGPDIIIFNEIEVDATPGSAQPDYAAILRRYSGVK